MWFFCSINAIVFKIHFLSSQILCNKKSVCPPHIPCAFLCYFHIEWVLLLDPCSHVQILNNMPIPNHIIKKTASPLHHQKLLTSVIAEEWASHVNSHAVLLFHIKSKNGHDSCWPHDISASERNLPSECQATGANAYCVVAGHLYNIINGKECQDLRSLLLSSFEASWELTVAAVSHGDLCRVTNHMFLERQ